MSDLLIRNIEIPKAFQRLRLTIMSDGSVSIVNSFNEAVVPTEAKAEILEEHGDLIQRDDFLDCLQQIMVEVRRMATEEQGKVATIFYDTVVEMVKLCPVVLPKSGS